jgi:hypothetical protein
MNCKQALALTLLAFAGSAALADDITMADPAVSTKSRAAVQAEVLKACEDGTLLVGGELLRMRAPAAPAMSTLSRDVVRAQIGATVVRTAGLVEAP